MTEKTKVASECLCALYFIHSLSVSVSLSDTHSLFLTHSLTHSQTHAYTLEQRQQIRVGARQQGKWYLYLHIYSWLMDWLNQPTHTHPAQSNTLIIGGQNTQVRTRVHTAFVQSEVNMGLVMGTFSMQSKPVNYHKGKTFSFIFICSKYFFYLVCVFCCEWAPVCGCHMGVGPVILHVCDLSRSHVCLLWESLILHNKCIMGMT